MYLHTHALYSIFDRMQAFGSYAVKMKNQNQPYLRNETTQESNQTWKLSLKEITFESTLEINPFKSNSIMN